LNIFKRARIRYILHRHQIPHPLWLQIAENLNVLQGLSAVEKAHLRELTTLFLYEKNFIGAQDLNLTDAMRITIAIQACLPILRLGLSCLSGWTDIIVYPGPFRVTRDIIDTAGVVHRQENILSGESWSRGPVVVSWADVEEDVKAIRRGHNVVIHEIAHKLDALNGNTNGYPPLHYQMSAPQWTATLSEAYQFLLQRLDHRQYSGINPYAASSPAEFFAVVSEYFFCLPDVLHAEFADVYQQLQLYYRQNPLQRLHSE
jgi:Mlc titration factor MtfA (ptsG expression regulator)